MPSSAIATVVVALLIPGALYIYLAVRAHKNITSVFQYLPLERDLNARGVSATMIAAGMSMATVMVALTY